MSGLYQLDPLGELANADPGMGDARVDLLLIDVKRIRALSDLALGIPGALERLAAQEAQAAAARAKLV